MVVAQEQPQAVSTQVIEQAAVVQESVDAASITNLETEVGTANVIIDGARLAVEPREDAVAAPDEALLAAAESRSRQAIRFNRNLLIGTISVLSFFIVCRLVLLWQIARHRKRLPREENAFEN